MDHLDEMNASETLDAGGCSRMSALLQPFIDDELDAREHDSIAEHLDDCPACRSEVQRQHAVRSALRQLEFEPVPEGLLERIREELDRVDLEDGDGVIHIDQARPVSRLRAFGRGVGMMLPAAAAAVALFFVVRANPTAETAEAAGILAASGSQAVERSAEDPRAAAATPIARAPLPEGIELVGGAVDPAKEGYHYADRRTGLEFRGFVRPAGRTLPQGTRQMFRGQAYFLSRDARGRAQVQLMEGGSLYTFVEVSDAPTQVSEGPLDIQAPAFRRLVTFSESIRDAAR